MAPLRSHTHLQATQIHAQTKACKRVCLPNRTTDRQARPKKNNEGITAPWQKSGFNGYINICASNKLLWWLDSFAILSPLLRQAAKR